MEERQSYIVEEINQHDKILTVRHARKIGSSFELAGTGAPAGAVGRALLRTFGVIVLGFLCCVPAMAQDQTGSLSNTQQPTPQSSSPQQNSQILGIVRGNVVDPSGAAVMGAGVKLQLDGQSTIVTVLTGENGEYSFSDVAAGPFHLTITAAGFASQTLNGTLHPGEIFIAPQVALELATALTQVQVTLTNEEIAEAQVQDQEKQRVLGVFPNFYVSYVRDAAPLNTKQKFQLAWKSTIDPVTFGVTGATAGIQQATNAFKGYGQGAAGYGRRFGADYGDAVAGTFIAGAILPSILKQDPRYFYKGTGSTRSRLLYAISMSVICKGDNGHWQPNFSAIFGNLAAGGLSNLYYPASDRNGVGLTFENFGIGIGATAATNILQEFFIKRWTPSVHNSAASSSTP
jgi:uncharacterized protein YdeI (BOF family)